MMDKQVLDISKAFEELKAIVATHGNRDFLPISKERRRAARAAALRSDAEIVWFDLLAKVSIAADVANRNRDTESVARLRQWIIDLHRYSPNLPGRQPKVAKIEKIIAELQAEWLEWDAADGISQSRRLH